MRPRAARLVALAALLLFIALASTASAANASVEIAGFAFDPPSVTIGAGESVTWTNRDQAAHSAVFANNGPRTPVLTGGGSASLTFTTAGTFTYICGIHGNSMSGSVLVRAAATPAQTAPPPTPAPTPVPTARPTLAPTVAPTAEPPATASPTASAAPTSAAPSPTTAPTVAVVPTEQAPAPSAVTDSGGPSLPLIGAAVIAALAVGAVALARIRR